MNSKEDELWAVRFCSRPSGWFSPFKTSSLPVILNDWNLINQVLPVHLEVELLNLVDIGEDTGFALLQISAAKSKQLVEWLESEVSCVVEFHKQTLKKRFHRVPVSSSNQESIAEGELKQFMENVKRDEMVEKQWHFWNSTSSDRQSMETWGAWQRGVTGKGVTVAVVDDGADIMHKDLAEAYESQTSWDFVTKTPVLPPTSREDNHGTRCSGQIAARRNGYLGVGVAYDVRLSVIRLLSSQGTTQDVTEAAALTYKYQQNHIYSLSWGPADDGETIDGPGRLARKALSDGTTYGRGGKGSIYVLASGNGGEVKDSCGGDGYSNSIYTITVGAVSEAGQWPVYAEPCSAQLISAYGGNRSVGIYTTDLLLNGIGWTNKHYGTSAAAPFVSASLALLLQERPDLTWRDVQNLLVISAVPTNINHPSWHVNGAGFTVSESFGFGVLNVDQLLQKGRTYQPLPKAGLYKHSVPMSEPFQIKYNMHKIVIVVSKPDTFDSTTPPAHIEHVELEISLRHPKRGDLEIRLTSPRKTEVTLLHHRPNDNSDAGLKNWSLMSVHWWGEQAWGEWVVEIRNRDSLPGQIQMIELRIHGVPCPRPVNDGRCQWEVDADKFRETILIGGGIVGLLLAISILAFAIRYAWKRGIFRNNSNLVRSQSLESNRLRSKDGYIELKDITTDGDVVNQKSMIPSIQKSASTDTISIRISRSSTPQLARIKTASSSNLLKTSQLGIDLAQLPSPQVSNPLESPATRAPRVQSLASILVSPESDEELESPGALKKQQSFFNARQT